MELTNAGIGSHSLAGSRQAMERAERVLARGCASAARLRTTTTSLVLREANGAHVVDVDGNRYIDFVLALGPVILGHRPPRVLAAVERSFKHGVIFGAQHDAEAEFCEVIVAAVPAAEIVTLCSTGSEAIHFAVRLARASTRRKRIVKFEGHYHGWTDPLFVNTPGVPAIQVSPAGPTHAVFGQDDSDVSIVRWNDIAELERAFTRGEPVAAVFMEPIPCNFGTYLPSPGYMEAVQQLCAANGTLLVFDEVLTGFRIRLGGAQERIGLVPDITIGSKAVASGFPIAFVAGSRKALAPAIDGSIRAAGTYNGSPPSVAAGVATVAELTARRHEIYPRLDDLGELFANGIRAAARVTQAPLVVNQVGSVLQLFWGIDEPVMSYAHACDGDQARIAELGGRLLSHGLHVAERGLLLLSAAHVEEDIAVASQAFKVALKEMQKKERA